MMLGFTILTAIQLFLFTFSNTFYLSSFALHQPYGCDPNGKVWISGFQPTRVLSMWNLEYALTITIPYGDLSFSTAKTIDICWDAVVGRGYPPLSALFLYKVFRTVTTDMMKSHSLPQE